MLWIGNIIFSVGLHCDIFFTSSPYTYGVTVCTWWDPSYEDRNAQCLIEIVISYSKHYLLLHTFTLRNCFIRKLPILPLRRLYRLFNSSTELISCTPYYAEVTSILQWTFTFYRATWNIWFLRFNHYFKASVTALDGGDRVHPPIWLYHGELAHLPMGNSSWPILGTTIQKIIWLCYII